MWAGGMCVLASLLPLRVQVLGSVNSGLPGSKPWKHSCVGAVSRRRAGVSESGHELQGSGRDFRIRVIASLLSIN